MATAAQMVAKARSQVGITEKGYSNKVKYNDWYWGKGKYGSWAAWCAVGLCWCADQIGMRKNVDYPYTAGVAVAFSWFDKHGRIHSKHKAKAGDWARGKGFSHVMLVRHRNGRSSLSTTEFNTSPGSSGSQRDGGGVWNRVRPMGLIQYVGRPNYTGTSSASPKPEKKKRGIFGMTLKTRDSNSPKQRVPKGHETTVRTCGKGTYRMANVKPNETVFVDEHLRISGLREGQVAEVWIRLGEYTKKKGYTRYNYPRQTVYGRAGGGDVHVSLPLVDKISMSPRHKGSLRLYVIVKNVSGDECVVEYSKHTILSD